MLIKSLPLRITYALIFGILVGTTSAATGGPPAWVVGLGVVTALVAFAAQTLYVKMNRARALRGDRPTSDTATEPPR